MCKALGVSFMHLDWLKSCFLSLWFTFPSWRNKQTSKQATVIPLFLAVCSVLTFVSDSVFWSFANPSGIIVECFCLRGQSLNTKLSNVLKKKKKWDCVYQEKYMWFQTYQYSRSFIPQRQPFMDSVLPSVFLQYWILEASITTWF